MTEARLEGVTIVLTHSCESGDREVYHEKHPKWWHRRDRDTGREYPDCWIRKEFDRMLCMSMEQVLDQTPYIARCGNAIADQSNLETTLRCTVIGPNLKLDLFDDEIDVENHWSTSLAERVGLGCQTLSLEDPFELDVDVLALRSRGEAA